MGDRLAQPSGWAEDIRPLDEDTAEVLVRKRNGKLVVFELPTKPIVETAISRKPNDNS